MQIIITDAQGVKRVAKQIYIERGQAVSVEPLAGEPKDYCYDSLSGIPYEKLGFTINFIP